MHVCGRLVGVHMACSSGGREAAERVRPGLPLGFAGHLGNEGIAAGGSDVGALPGACPARPSPCTDVRQSAAATSKGGGGPKGDTSGLAQAGPVGGLGKGKGKGPWDQWRPSGGGGAGCKGGKGMKGGTAERGGAPSDPGSSGSGPSPWTQCPARRAPRWLAVF